MQQAAQIRALAEAEAEKAARIGIGEAIAIEEKVRAYGGPQFQVTQQVMNRFAEAIERAGVDVVPRMVVGGGANGSGGASGNLMEGLLAMLLSERMGTPLNGNGNGAGPEVEALRKQIRDGLLASRAQEAAPVAPAVPPAPVPTTPLK